MAGFLFLAAGLWAQCSFNFSPSILNFGTVPAGSQATLQLTLTPSVNKVGPASYSLSSTNPSVFTVSPSSLPASNSSQAVNVIFFANSIGSFNGNILIGSSCLNQYSGSGDRKSVV